MNDKWLRMVEKQREVMIEAEDELIMLSIRSRERDLPLDLLVQMHCMRRIVNSLDVALDEVAAAMISS